MADGTRRQVVRHLRGSDGAATLDELAAAVNDSNGRHQALVTEFVHANLPKLADCEIAEYESEPSHRVWVGPRFDEVVPLLDMNEDVGNDLATDDLFAVLGDRRRRMVLSCLYRYTNPVSLPHLADCVTVREYDVDPDEIPSRRLRVYVSLYH